MAIASMPQERLFDADAEQVIQQALALLAARAKYGPTLSAPAAVRDFFRLELAAFEQEAFWCAWLTSQHRLIALDEICRGTIGQITVYPREVVKAALRHNAASVIFAHNHPGGSADPSCADEAITVTLKRALALVDVRVLDHFIVSGGDGTWMSFAERGLL
jgi:DNA repair protein RadC